MRGLLLRILLAASVASCKSKAEPQRSPELAASPAAAAPSDAPAPPPSRGWQSNVTGFVPDNSDLEAYRQKHLADPPAATQPLEEDAAIEVRFGSDTRTLTSADLVKLPRGNATAAGRGEERPLSAVVAWAFPGRAWHTMTLSDASGGTTKVRRADVDAGNAIRIRLNRRGALRLVMPEAVGTTTRATEHGGRGDGVQRKQRSTITAIELE